MTLLPRSRLSRIVLACIATCFVYWIIQSWRALGWKPADQRVFDATEWRSEPEFGYDIGRLRMIDDVRERIVVPGMAEDAVLELLGAPTVRSPGEWGYALGMHVLGGRHAYWLRIDFDSSSRVAGTRFFGIIE